jgi:MFS family permease
MADQVLTPVEERVQLRRAVIASTIGTTIEWYDFFLYGTAAALVFPKIFFPQSQAYVGLIESFSTIFVGFLSRPIGAAIFGHFGDRIGRKATLITTLLLMGIATILIGLLPGYATWGSGAGLVLVALRFIQGLGVGGEWGGSVLLSMEWHRGRRRGFIASWSQFGVPMGLLLSSLAVRYFAWSTGEDFLAIGWRYPFLLSALLLAVGLFIRLRVLETPAFARLAEERRLAPAPVQEAVREHWPTIGLAALARLAEQAPFYIFTTFVLSYGTGTLKLTREFLLDGVLIAAAVSLFTVPFFGWLSDVVGRKRLYVVGALVMAVYGFVYFGLLDSGKGALVILAIVLSLVAHDIMYGPQAAFIAECFPTRLRYSGASLGYQLASIIAGGPAPLIAAALFQRFHTGTAIAVYIALAGVISAIAAAYLGRRATAADVAEPTVVDAYAPAMAGSKPGSG